MQVVEGASEGGGVEQEVAHHPAPYSLSTFDKPSCAMRIRIWRERQWLVQTGVQNVSVRITTLCWRGPTIIPFPGSGMNSWPTRRCSDAVYKNKNLS